MSGSTKCGLVLLCMFTALSVGVVFGDKGTIIGKAAPMNGLNSNNLAAIDSNTNVTDAADAGSAIIDNVTYGKMSQLVEIKNNETSALDLTGWKLEVQNKTVYTFPKYMLGVNAKINVHSGAGKDSKTDLYTMTSMLTKADDEVSLLDSMGKVIDASEELKNETSDSPNDA
jgi:competence protein ComEC